MFRVYLSMDGVGVRIVKALRDLGGMNFRDAKAAIADGSPVAVGEFESKGDADEARGAAQLKYPFLDFRVEEHGEDAPLVEDTEETLPVVCDADLLVPGPSPYDDEPPF